MVRPKAEDVGLWRRAVHDVVPLHGRATRPGRVFHPPAPLPDPLPRTAEGTPGARAGKMPTADPPPLPPLDRFAGVDRATAERVKRGRYPVEARLDLHGMTQDEAHRALSAFVATSRAAGRRCVLVITGHGRMSGGVLKAAVPRWLDEPGLRRHLLAIAPARPHDGGAGALYVLLRRPP